MIHPLYDVVDFRIVAPYTLWIRFDDETEQVIDFTPVLFGEMFGPLRRLDHFNRVMLDPEVRNLIWPNGADFDPWTLHDWPQVVDELAARARTWLPMRSPAVLSMLDKVPA